MINHFCYNWIAIDKSSVTKPHRSTAAEKDKLNECCCLWNSEFNGTSLKWMKYEFPDVFQILKGQQFTNLSLTYPGVSIFHINFRSPSTHRHNSITPVSGETLLHQLRISSPWFGGTGKFSVAFDVFLRAVSFHTWQSCLFDLHRDYLNSGSKMCIVFIELDLYSSFMIYILASCLVS